MQLIAVTGYAADEEVLTAAGFDGHIIKPVNFQALEETLAGVAASRGLARRQGDRRPATPAFPEPPTSPPVDDPAAGDD